MDENVGLREIPEDWIYGIPVPNIPNYDETWDEKYFLRNDLLPSIYKMFDQYGVEYFKDLHIWHIPQLRNKFLK